MSPNMRVDEQDYKLRQLILYISRACMADETYGATKLNKILFYSDFLAYLRLGRPITGQEYQRLQFGPVPRRLLPVRDSMIDAKELAVPRVSYFDRVQERPMALVEPDISKFSPEEIAIVDDVIRRLWGLSATDVSVLSHRFIGWQVAEENETIPYEVALIARREPTREEIEHARGLQGLAARVLSGGDDDAPRRRPGA